MTHSIREKRERLWTDLLNRKVKGVVGVGIGKDQGSLVLTVAVNDEFDYDQDSVPEEFYGLHVVKRNYGDATAQPTGEGI